MQIQIDPIFNCMKQVGVIYTGSAAKQEEHGGFAHDDINVMLLLSKPGIQAVPSLLKWEHYRSRQQSFAHLD